MIVRPFHSEDELSRRFGKEFIHLWRRLTQVYALKKRQVRVTSLHAASMAFLFYSAALSGDVETGHHFDHILRGKWSEAMEMDGQWVRLTDEASVDFVWDTVAIMLEVDHSLAERAQWAYDIVDYHVVTAYQVTQSLAEHLNEPVCAPAAALAPCRPAASVTPVPTTKQTASSSQSFTSGQIDRFINHMNSLSSRDERAAVARAIKCCMFDAEHPDLAHQLHQAVEGQPSASAPITVNNYYNGTINQQVNHQVNMDTPSTPKKA